MVDRRSDPTEFYEHRKYSFEWCTDRYHRGHDSVHVYRASLHCLGYRGDDIEMLVRSHAPIPKPVPKDKYRIEGGKVVPNA